jgi:hypothetical protein
MTVRQTKSPSRSTPARKRPMSVEEKAVHGNDARRQADNTGGKRAAHRKGVTEQGKPRSYD